MSRPVYKLKVVEQLDGEFIVHTYHFERFEHAFKVFKEHKGKDRKIYNIEDELIFSDSDLIIGDIY